MKKKLFLLSVMFFTVYNASFATVNQKLENINIQTVDSALLKQINLIKSQYKDIETNLKSYKKTVATIDGEEGSEASEVVKYFDNKLVKKIKVSSSGETGNLVEEYLFWEGKLIFYYSGESKYNMPVNAISNTRNIKVAGKIEKRYYFNNGSIIKYITTPSANISLRMLTKISTDIQNESKTLLR
jgi:hypothetical protein